MTREYRHLPRLEATNGEFGLHWIEDRDIEPIREWRNAQMEVLRQDTPITRDQQAVYFAQKIWPQMDSKRPDPILTVIERKGKRIGYGGLVHCAWDQGRAEISVLFAPEIAGNPGRYRVALLAFLTMIESYSFDALGLHRLTLETYDIRPFHIELLEQAGYRCEGRLRQHVEIDGSRVDSLLHAKLRQDHSAGSSSGGRISSLATRSILVPAGGAS